MKFIENIISKSKTMKAIHLTVQLFVDAMNQLTAACYGIMQEQARQREAVAKLAEKYDALMSILDPEPIVVMDEIKKAKKKDTAN
jgi:hypothetical protein